MSETWDTSNGRRWVVVAFWGVETTVDFHRDRDEASAAFEQAVESGADAFYAETQRMQMQSDAEFKDNGRLAKPKAKHSAPRKP